MVVRETMKYKICDTNCLVSIVFQDFNYRGGAMDFLNEIIRDKRYNPTYNFLIDLREIKYTPIIQEMEQLSKCIITFKEHFKGIAAIVTHNEIHHYLFKYAAIILSKNGLKNRIFCEPEYALNWLIDPAEERLVE